MIYQEYMLRRIFRSQKVLLFKRKGNSEIHFDVPDMNTKNIRYNGTHSFYELLVKNNL